MLLMTRRKDSHSTLQTSWRLCTCMLAHSFWRGMLTLWLTGLMEMLHVWLSLPFPFKDFFQIPRLLNCRHGGKRLRKR